MAKLLYVSPMSLDGYLGDGNYEWSAPSDEAMAMIIDVMRPVKTYLYGRKMYETMDVWETPNFMPNMSEGDHEFARMWQAADKIVYSKSLATVSSKKTRIERSFDVQMIRELKAHSPGDITVGGANLAAQAIDAGLVDEYHFFVVPMTIGGGIAVMPKSRFVKLDLLNERRTSDGWIHLHYRSQS